ncbi:CRTAC1 family protein [Crateriforma conspicua]|uniref:ASPIC and UnbV n=1 Tax=Crateriforma conspicua TaxID=2527996 RepID=A0A5C5Y8C6_9PLAN|nr:CRTAC1 family protein [Crateriforma conspicua]TWT69602.1 ASPIC and UnbV [Crateriforma conspicua]
MNEPIRDENTEDDAIIGVALRRSVLVIGLLAIAGGLMWLVFAESPEPPQPQVFETVNPELRQQASDLPTLTMTDVSDSAGVDFLHHTGRAGEKLLPETMGSGVAVFDFNGDGHQDLFWVNGDDWPWSESPSDPPPTCRLFQGDGQGNFTDVSEDQGAALKLYGMGVATADFDNDGDADLFVSAVGKNRLLRNDDGRFVEITDAAGVAGADDAWSTSCGFFDFDRDGYLDLFVCNYVAWDRDSDLSQNFTLDGINRAYGPPRAFNGTFSYLYRNNGDGTFADVSQAAGIQIRNPDTDVPLGKAMGLAPVDVNDDGWIDIIVANDTVRNFLFENQGDGTFVELGQLCGIAYDRSGNARGAMGIDCSRFRSDGTLAVGIGNFANEASALYMTRPGRDQFVDAAMFTGFGPPTRQGLTFGLFFFDADLDGRPDVLGANGHLEDDIAKTQSTQRYHQPPQLFWNAGPDAGTELVLTSAEHTGDGFQQPIVGRGAAYGDFDDDGDPDVVISTSGGPARVFRNDQPTGHHFLKVRLVGTESNRDAIGANVTLTSGDAVVSQTVMPTRSYLSQCQKELIFGLGDVDQVDSIRVAWPSGNVESFDADAVDSTVVFREGDGLAVSDPDD